MASAPSKTTIDARVKLFDTMANSIAWHVGVVTPGFLGLLWYSDKLAKATWLPRGGFVAVFVLSELFFLLAIIGALILLALIWALVFYRMLFSRA